MIIAISTLVAFLFITYCLRNRAHPFEISGHVFKRRIPAIMTDTWKMDLRDNAQKLDNTLVGNPEILAYFIVENIQDYRKGIY